MKLQTGILGFLVIVPSLSIALTQKIDGKICRAVYGKPGWPSEEAWNNLRRQVDGFLIAASPPGAACQQTLDGVATYNSAKCTAARFGWMNQDFQ
jgi:hypothetical protein